MHNMQVPTFDENWVGPTEAARIAHCSAQWLHKLAERGDLPHVQTPNGRVFFKADLEKLRDERKAKDEAA